jgi:hypothetical protein
VLVSIAVRAFAKAYMKRIRARSLLASGASADDGPETVSVEVYPFF